ERSGWPWLLQRRINEKRTTDYQCPVRPPDGGAASAGSGASESAATQEVQDGSPLNGNTGQCWEVITGGDNPPSPLPAPRGRGRIVQSTSFALIQLMSLRSLRPTTSTGWFLSRSRMALKFLPPVFASLIHSRANVPSWTSLRIRFISCLV